MNLVTKSYGAFAQNSGLKQYSASGVVRAEWGQAGERGKVLNTGGEFQGGFLEEMGFYVVGRRLASVNP
jgi:hypothetical protein